jgi:hypothetical protein
MTKSKLAVMRAWLAGAISASCAVAPMFGGATAAQSASGDASQLSTLCRFSQGPHAGQTLDYAPRLPLPVGAACWDGISGYGTIVAGGPPPTPHRPTRSHKARPSSQTTMLCQFSQGPRTGQAQDYAPRLPLPVGSACWDGVASYGTLVAGASPPP